MTLSLAEAIDTHVHTSPDVVARAQGDLELVESAASAGMRAVVLKSHHFPTADRAQVAQGCFPHVTVIGGLALNKPSSGGVNPDAVEACLSVGGRFVWLPTISAQNHQQYVTSGRSSTHIKTLTKGNAVVAVTRADDQVVAELDAVFDLVAHADAVLATGHIAPREAIAVIKRAQERGVRRVVVTHPELPLVAMPIDTQHSLAKRGVYFERCYYSVLAGLRPSDLIDQIRAVGVTSTVLATDLGQADNPPPVDGFRSYGELLIANGLTSNEWWTMTRANPARLLGLD